MGSKSTPQTVTNETRLPEWLQPAMERGVTRAEDLYQQGSPSVSYTGPSQTTQNALAMMQQQANQGINPAITGNYNATLNGDFLHGGQGFNAALEAAQNRIMPQVQGMFSAGGRTNSGLAQTAMTQALGDSFANLYSQERGRQMQALGMAPQMTDLSYQPARMLGQVGAARDAQLAEEAAVNDFNANAPARSLDEYLMRIQGIAPHAGGISTQTRPLYENKTNSLLGIGMMGAGLLTGNPMMAMSGGQSLFGGSSGGLFGS